MAKTGIVNITHMQVIADIIFIVCFLLKPDAYRKIMDPRLSGLPTPILPIPRQYSNGSGSPPERESFLEYFPAAAYPTRVTPGPGFATVTGTPWKRGARG